MVPRAHPNQSSKKRPAHKPGPRAARPTVLHLCADLEPGDPARETVDLAILSQRAGWRTLIVSSGGLLVQEAERAAVRHTAMPIGKRHMLANWRNRLHLRALVQKEKPVLIHAHGPEATAHALAVSRAAHLPLIADFTQPPQNPAYMKNLLKQLEKLSATVRVPSEFMAQRITGRMQWPADRLALIPPGIDLQWFDARAISAERLQTLSRLWRLPEHSSVVIVPPPLTAGSGHRLFLQALAQIKGAEIFAVLVGDNRTPRAVTTEIEALITHHGLQGKVITPDYCLDWPAACWLANIMVAPHSAGRGQFPELLAAQALGRPVIAMDCGANTEMVESGETAWVIPSGNARVLAQALEEAIGLDTAQRLELAARTRNFVTGHFPQASWFNGMMDLYESMAGLRAHPARAA